MSSSGILSEDTTSLNWIYIVINIYYASKFKAIVMPKYLS